MFIRFESDGLKRPQQRTVECIHYQGWDADDGSKNIQLDDGPVYNLTNSQDCWQRAYVMNGDGRTIETIHASLK